MKHTANDNERGVLMNDQSEQMNDNRDSVQMNVAHQAQMTTSMTTRS